MNKNLNFWLALLHANINPQQFFRCLNFFSSIENIFMATEAELIASGISEKLIMAIKNPPWKMIEEDLHWMNEKKQQYIITLDDNAYPALLKKISAPPLVLYVLGNKNNLHDKQIAIVGSRAASFHGKRNAYQFAFELSQLGLTITSGLALGIDGASHEGALAAKGKTIGVAGTGLAVTYPLHHKKLCQEIIAADGTIISEFPLQTQPIAFNFPRRNRIIAGLSLGVLVVEAALKSGSLITAKNAIDEGREVFAIPGNIQQCKSQGCHYLIKQGAKLVETTDDILQEIPYFQAELLPKQKKSATKLVLSAHDQGILEKIDYEITPMDNIIMQSGLTASEVSSILLTLELQGYIKSVNGGFVRI